MSDVTLSYKGSDILELSDSGSATLKTGGKYCEDDIELEYVKPSGGSTDNVVVALPSGYKVVNCVSIPMGGYVNTLIVPTNDNNDYYLDARLDTPISEISTAAMLIGCRAYQIFAYIGVYNTYSSFVFQILTNDFTQLVTKDNQRHVFQSRVGGNLIAVDETTASGAVSSSSVNMPMLIAARQTKDGTGIERNCAMTVWRYTHIKGALKAIDLIPCQRKSDGEYGFYDLVSESFFGNLGTGTFTEGVE